MELVLIFNKLIILIYIIVTTSQSDQMNVTTLVITMLLLLCANMAIYVVNMFSGKHKWPKQLFMLCAIGIVCVAYIQVDWLFILLLPILIYELGITLTTDKWLISVVSVVPGLFMIDMVHRPLYGLSALLSLLLLVTVQVLIDRFNRLEAQSDVLRIDIQRLTKKLHGNTEFIRQSEYTYKLEERNRISQEIHDQIGHSMTSALIQMEASKRLIDLDKNKAVELLQNAIQISKEGIENIRLTLKNKKPPTEQMGIHRLKLAIDEFSNMHAIQAHFTHQGNLDSITAIQWKIIQENITEALTNSMKYADATSIAIDIQVLNKFIKAMVKDNGKGSSRIKKGLGIVGMEERAAALNGTVIIDGSSGFSVTTLLPIKT
ncbi:histidine kinase [Paenibacillus sp. N1-5-1-14]|uniref:sensor histidine kinase n=1 Tax=Paenibacillus radicibacter TaxID=2972488 RepID=UPI0021599A6D|nr:histidine kinase [Paenibacillus radicibacter]MCR8642730.1 histidine kinase [Paenibacillus radicibacter]